MIRMSKTLVSLSFDDGRKDNYDIVLPILQEYGLTATFNIATAYVDGSIPKELSPCVNPSMDREQVKQLYQLGFEVAGHGDFHINTDNDIITGIKKLRSWLSLPGDAQFGFASPCSELNKEQILKKMGAYKANGLFYIRVSIADDMFLIKKIERKLAHLTGNRWIYYKAFKKSIGLAEQGFLLYSIPVLNKATLKQVKYLLWKAIRSQKNCVLMFHTISDRGGLYRNDTWSWDKDKFAGLCKWLHCQEEAGHLSVVTTAKMMGGTSQ